MGLFTDPVVLDTDHTFQFLGQVFDKKSTVGVYIEPAAALSAESKLTVKHRESSTVKSHLLQRTIKKVPAADATGALQLITVNLTMTAHPLFTEAEVQAEVDIALDAAAVANFVKNMLLGAI